MIPKKKNIGYSTQHFPTDVWYDKYFLSSDLQLFAFLFDHIFRCEARTQTA